MHWQTIVGVIMILIGIWQFYATHSTFKLVKTKGTKNGFMPLALWDSSYFGIEIIAVGLGLVFYKLFF